jgi:ribosomal-protein-serine acetyltransferase
MNHILLDVPEQLESERLTLRAIRPGDGAIVFPSVRECLPELKVWMPWATDDYSEPLSEEWCRNSAAGWIKREQFQFLILLRPDNRHVGTIGSFKIDWKIPACEIGYWLHTALNGQGLMTEAVKTVTAMLFDRLQFQRVQICADELNTKSRRVAELAGYQFEGILRKDCRVPDGRLRNTSFYSRIREP